MPNVGYATLQIIPSAKGFAAALGAETNGPMTAVGGDGGKKFGGGMLAAAKGFVGPLAAVFAVGAGVEFFKGAITQASGLGESLNALKVVYGDNAKGIEALGKSAAKNLGLSNLDFNNLAVQFSNFANTIAGPGGDVVGTLESITGRAADFASVMNLEVADATALFQSGLAGESEPLRKYGIDMSAAAVEAYALANGIGENAGALTEAEKVQARYGLIMASTAKAQGDFANTSGGLANQQRILGAQWDDMKGRLGNALLPAVTAVVTGMNGLIGTVGKVGEAFSAGFSGDTSSFTGVLGVVAQVGDGFGALVTFFNTVAKPAVVEFFASFSSGGAGAGSFLTPLVTGIQSIIPPLLSASTTLVTSFFPVIQQVATFIAGTVGPIFSALVGIVTGSVIPAVLSMATFFSTVLAPKIAELVSLVSANLQPVLAGVTGFITGAVIPAVQQIAAKFRDWQPAIQAVISVVVTIISKVVEFAAAILGKVIPPVLSLAGFLLRNLVPAVLGAIQIIGSIIGSIFNFGAAIIGAVGKVGEFAAGVRSKIGEALSTIGQLPGKAVSALGNLGSTLLSAGGDLIGGFIRGITNRAGSLVSTIRSTITDKLPAFVKSALGIASPSRVFMALGEHTANGMAVGITKGGKAVQKAADALVPNAPAFASPEIRPSAGSASGSAPTAGLAIHGDVYTQNLDDFARWAEERERDAATLYGLAGVMH